MRCVWKGFEVDEISGEFTAHTVSQRLRRLRKIPAELIPLGELPRYILHSPAWNCAHGVIQVLSLPLPFLPPSTRAPAT
jgi:hypothetical protein